MTTAMFIFLLLWIVACTAKPENKSFMAGVHVRETDRTWDEILREYK